MIAKVLFFIFIGCCIFIDAKDLHLPRSSKKGSNSVDDCKAGICGGMASYPVAPGMKFYSTFNVPGLPKNQSAIDNDITFFIYTN